MAEFRIYSGNGGYPSSYSNLSPLAPPFNVDRSNPRPPPAAQVVAPAETSYNSPLDSTSSNWADSSRKDGYMPLDSMLPSNIYPFHGNDYFSGATFNVPSRDSISTPSTAPFSYGANTGSKQVEFSQAAVCYPSNLTPVVCKPSPHDATLKEPFQDLKSSLGQKTKFDGFWEGSSWDPFQTGSFSKEKTTAALPVPDDRTSSGGHMLKFKGLPDEASLGIYMLGKEPQVGIAGLGNGHSDYYPREHPSDVSFVKQPVHGSCSVHPGTSLQPLQSTMKAVNSKGNQATCSSPYQKQSISYPAFFSKPLVAGSSTSISDAVSFGAVDHVFCAIDVGASVTKGSNVKEQFPIPKHGRDGCFNSSLGSMQLQNNDHVSFGAVDHVFCATDMGASVTKGSNVKEQFHIPRHGRDGCFNSSPGSMQLQNNDHVSSKVNATGNGEAPKSGLSRNNAFDHFGVDCCSRALPFDPRVLSPVFDDYEGSVRLEKPLDILDHYTPSVDSPCWKGSSGSHFSPFGTAKVVVRHNEVLEACGSNVLEPQAEIGLNSVKVCPADPSNGLGYCEIENVGDGSMVSMNKPTVSLQLVESPFHDAKETISCMKKDTCSNDGCKGTERTEGYEQPDKSLNEPNESVSKLDLKLCQPTRQSFQDKSSASDNLYQLKTSVADASGANMSFLSTGESTDLHSLGTPAMYHQSCEKTTAKNHVRTLVGTIYNLSEMLLYYCSVEDDKLEEQDFEALKNVTDNLRKCVPKNYAADPLLPELQKGTHVDSQQSAASSDLGQPKLSEPCEKVKYSTSHNMESSSSLCIKADAGMYRKDEKLIKAIQLALRGKFHDKEEHPQITLYKNLWLEAEAALCASNCTARYNHMKFEVGKNKSESSRDLLQETLGEKKVSGAEPDDKLQPGAKDGSSSADISIQNSASAVTSKDYDDVMARFHMLESHGNGSTNYNKAKDEDEVPSARSSQFNSVDTPSPTEEKDVPTHDLLIQDLPIREATSKENDIDAAVMDRFHILKNRGEVSSSILYEGKSQLLVSKLDYVSGNKEGSHCEDIIEYEGDNAPALQNSAAEICGNKWVWKNVDVNSEPVAQSLRSGSKFGNSISSVWYDNSSSEWEHVLSEEL